MRAILVTTGAVAFLFAVLGSAPMASADRTDDSVPQAVGIDRSSATLATLPNLSGRVSAGGAQTAHFRAGEHTRAASSDDVAPFQGVAAFSADLGADPREGAFWAAGAYAQYESDLAGVGSDGAVGVVSAGIEMRLGDRALLGLMVMGDQLDAEVGPLSIATEATGFLIGPYVVIGLTDNVSLEGLAAAGVAYNDYATPGGATANYESDRLLLSARLSGEWRADRWSFRPATRITYYAERQEAFADSLGATFGEDVNELGQLRFGPEIGYALPLEGGAILAPFAGVEGVWAFAQSSHVINGALAAQENFATSVSLGLDVSIGAATLRGGGRVEGLGADNFGAVSGELQLRIPLN